MILARDREERNHLEALHPRNTAILTCENFGGPCALLMGESTPENIDKAAGLMLRYAHKPLPQQCEIRVKRDSVTEVIKAAKSAEDSIVDLMRIV